MSVLVRKVLISGKQGSGKTTLMECLFAWATHHGWAKAGIKFADPLYRMHDAVRDICLLYGIPMPVKDGDLLQYLGTEWGRKKFGDDIWAVATRDRVNSTVIFWDEKQIKYGLIVIDDCRFPNELDIFPDALRVRLNAPMYIRKKRCSYWRENDQHPSEVSLDSIGFDKFDLIIDTEKLDASSTARIVVERLAQFEIGKTNIITSQASESKQ